MRWWYDTSQKQALFLYKHANDKHLRTEQRSIQRLHHSSEFFELLLPKKLLKEAIEQIFFRIQLRRWFRMKNTLHHILRLLKLCDEQKFHNRRVWNFQNILRLNKRYLIRNQWKKLIASSEQPLSYYYTIKWLTQQLHSHEKTSQKLFSTESSSWTY